MLASSRFASLDNQEGIECAIWSVKDPFDGFEVFFKRQEIFKQQCKCAPKASFYICTDQVCIVVNERDMSQTLVVSIFVSCSAVMILSGYPPFPWKTILKMCSLVKHFACSVERLHGPLSPCSRWNRHAVQNKIRMRQWRSNHGDIALKWGEALQIYELHLFVEDQISLFFPLGGQFEK